MSFDEKLAETVFDLPLQDVDHIGLEKITAIKLLIANEIVGKKFGKLPSGYYPESHQELDMQSELQLEKLGLADACEKCRMTCGAVKPYGVDCKL